MTELSFLVELLLNHKLTKPTKDAIALRIKEVESNLPQSTQLPITASSGYITPVRPIKDPTAQAPSTQAILNADPTVTGHVIPPLPAEGPVQPAQIAKTQAAVQALNARQEAIRIAISGKEEKGRTSPRKF